MDKLLAVLGTGQALLCIVTSLTIVGPKMILYLTNVLLTAQLLFCVWTLLGLTRGKSYKILALISWSIGWQVFILYWAYMYPRLTEKTRLPLPKWYDFVGHGGIHLPAAGIFLLKPLKIELKDCVYPIVFALVYLGFLITPAKLVWGITIYPNFMEKVIPTIGLIIGSTVVIFVCFRVGMMLKQEKKKE